MHSPHTLSGEAGPCFICGQPCFPTHDAFRHGERCGALMRRMGEPCGRRKGHLDGHRTAFAVSCGNARRAAA